MAHWAARSFGQWCLDGQISVRGQELRGIDQRELMPLNPFSYLPKRRNLPRERLPFFVGERRVLQP